MQRSKIATPTLIVLYGLPGSGKSFFSRQAGELLGAPVISSDRIRYELFEKPTFSKEEQLVVFSMMNVMLEQYADLGMSVIYDASVSRASDRKLLREFAKNKKMNYILVWLQADAETCFMRAKTRDRRKADDKYSHEITREQFATVEKSMQPPAGEDPLVVSGKHLFEGQRNVILRKLREMQILIEDTDGRGFAKPELVNLVSAAKMKAGRYNDARRNVIIS